jgi:putative SOS response-associated peptidase YedK
MCNRYSSTKNEAHLQLRRAAIAIANLFTRYNVAPNTPAPVVALNGDSLVSREMGWGVRGYDGRLLTNAKSETARNKPMWRNSWAQHRCVIPADGYYEWKTEGRQKLPYRMVLKDDSLFWFAGLWSDELPTRPDAPGEGRYVILTRDPTPDLSRIHNRMPLILNQDEIEPWLAPETSHEWIPNGVPEGSLHSYRVGVAVGTPGLETPDCIKPLVGALEQVELW